MATAQDRSNRYRRKTDVKDTRKKILIVTEGKTEKEYFDEFKRLPSTVTIVIDGSDSKRSLVEATIKFRDDLIAQDKFDVDDEVWVVFDRDIDPQNKQDKDKFNQALQLAKNENINAAYSNDAVELWFLLHYQDLTANTHRDLLYRKLTGHLGFSYKKAEGAKIYHLIKDHRTDAIRRSEQLEQMHKGTKPCDANPSTRVHVLVKRLTSEGFRERDR